MVFFLNLFSQLPDFSAGRQAAVYKDADPVADLLNLIELVRRNQKSSAILPGKLQHKLQLSRMPSGSMPRVGSSMMII